MVTGFGPVGGKVFATMCAVHVAAVVMTFGAAMGPSGGMTKGVVPKVAVLPPEMTMVTEQVAPPVEVVVVA